MRTGREPGVGLVGCGIGTAAVGLVPGGTAATLECRRLTRSRRRAGTAVAAGLTGGLAVPLLGSAGLDAVPAFVGFVGELNNVGFGISTCDSLTSQF